MNDAVAVLINAQVFNELANYLGTKPFGEVAGFFKAFEQSPGLSQEQLETLQKEEAPE